MELKETIAKALYTDSYGGWETTADHTREYWMRKAEAVIKALEADVPKKLMDCLLSEDEIYRSFSVSEDAISLMAYPNASYETNYRCIAKAQLESSKLKAYIDSQVQAERDRHGTGQDKKVEKGKILKGFHDVDEFYPAEEVNK